MARKQNKPKKKKKNIAQKVGKTLWKHKGKIAAGVGGAILLGASALAASKASDKYYLSGQGTIEEKHVMDVRPRPVHKPISEQRDDWADMQANLNIKPHTASKPLSVAEIHQNAMNQPYVPPKSTMHYHWNSPEERLQAENERRWLKAQREHVKNKYKP